jgi:hypothetical protein
VLVGKEPSSDDDEDEEEYTEEDIQSPTAKRRKTPPPTPTQTPPTTPPTMPGSTKKQVSIMKPTGEKNISMKELNDSAAKMGLSNQELNVGQISIPILRGGWEKKIRKYDDDGGFITTKKSFSLIRMLPHSSMALKQCELLWLNPQLLQVGIVWPKWFRNAKWQIAFQTTGSEHKFDEDHDIIDSLQDDINNKQDVQKDKKARRIIEYGVFEFDLPQDTSKGAAEITILKVTLEDDDVGDDEEMAPGSIVKVLQIITEQKMNDEDDNLLKVGERSVKLGNFKLYCCIVLY